MRKIAISDIHGCLSTFKALLDKLAFSTSDKLFLIGDFIDRGPDAKGVIDYVIELREQGYNLVCLKGNHEVMMEQARKDSFAFNGWLDSGGLQTINSFQTNSLDAIAEKYWDFMFGLEYIVLEEPFIFVHAGLNFNAPNPLQDLDAMMWIRNWYDHIDRNWLGDRIIVHGHTPKTKSSIEMNFRLKDQLQYLDIDGGCFHIVHPGMGNLCAFDITNDQLVFQKNLDDMSSWMKR